MSNPFSFCETAAQEADTPESFLPTSLRFRFNGENLFWTKNDYKTWKDTPALRELAKSSIFSNLESTNLPRRMHDLQKILPTSTSSSTSKNQKLQTPQSSIGSTNKPNPRSYSTATTTEEKHAISSSKSPTSMSNKTGKPTTFSPLERIQLSTYLTPNMYLSPNAFGNTGRNTPMIGNNHESGATSSLTAPF
jgi:hypothetical protein